MKSNVFSRLLRANPARPLNKTKICVYTALYGGYDEVVEHQQQSVDCDFILFTDDSSTRSTSKLSVYIKPNPCDRSSNVLKNVWLRIFPFEIKELMNYDILIYIDANVRISDFMFVERIIKLCAKVDEFDLMLSAHPWNTCLYKEAQDSKAIPKYKYTDLDRQTALYREEGFPSDAGLYWNGFIVYNRASYRPLVRRFQEMYWHEMIAYNKTPDAHPQGQVSLPYCLWKSGIKVIAIPQLYKPPSPLEIRHHIG